MPKSSGKVKKDPKVVVFGQEVGTEDQKTREKFEKRFRWHHRRGSFTFGLFFIILGLYILLSNLGSLPPIVWSQVAKLWPILLILIGLDTLMGHSDISDFLSSLISLFIFLTILGVMFVLFAPQILAGLPVGITNYLHSIVNFLQLR